MAFPKFEDWKAPWDDTQEPFDAERARKYVYDVQLERSNINDQLTAAKTTQREAETQVAELTTKVAALEKDGGDVAKLKSDLADARAELERAKTASRSTMLDAVKAEFGLTDRQASKLVGDDLEALRTDARETFGDPVDDGQETPPGGDDDQETPPGGDDDHETPPAPKPTKRVPVARKPVRMRNSSDPKPEEKPRPSRDEVLASIPL